MAGRMIEFASNGNTAEGYLVTPESGSGAGVVVLQEYWGLVPHIKDIAERFAAEGYVALAPDLYHGEKTTSPDEAGKKMMALDIARTEKDLRGAIDFLLGHDAVTNKNGVGTIGFCMGGVLSLYAACANPEGVAACVIFYGIHPKVSPPLENLRAPVLGLYAENDEHVPVETVRELEAKLKALGKQADFHIYPDVGHAFFNDTRPEAYNPRIAQDAWRRTTQFFRQHLEGQ